MKNKPNNTRIHKDMIKVRKNGLPIHVGVQNIGVIYIYIYSSQAHTHSGSYTQ
jgi:hypothetical protein